MSLSRRGLRGFFFASIALLTLVTFLTIADGIPFYESLAKNVAAARTGVELPPPAEGDAIVVVTGDARRIPRALDLLAQRDAPILVISGVQPGVTLHQLLGASTVLPKDLLSRIVMETDAVSTRENALRSRPLLEANGVKRVILVTSDYHLYRTLRAFESIAKEFTYLPYPVSSETGDRFQKDGLFSEAFPKLVNEFLKLVFYKYVWRFRS